jgi:hypothetical protein
MSRITVSSYGSGLSSFPPQPETEDLSLGKGRHSLTLRVNKAGWLVSIFSEVAALRTICYVAAVLILPFGKRFVMGPLTTRVQVCLFCCALAVFFAVSCSLQANIPTVSDDAIEPLVRAEAEQIIAVSEDRGRFSDYRILLADFPRRDILGMSLGNRRIYISHELGRLALRNRFHLWLLRQTLAHEVGHETAGHAHGNRVSGFNRLPSGGGVTAADIGLAANVRFHHYSVDKELEADLKGMTYWRELQWDCRIWVGILKHFQEQNYSGGVFHPTDQRLEQAKRVCPAPLAAR